MKMGKYLDSYIQWLGTQLKIERAATIYDLYNLALALQQDQEELDYKVGE